MEGDDTVDTTEFFEEENKTNKKHNERGCDHGYNENGALQVGDFEYEQGLPAASIEPMSEGSVSTVEDRKLKDKERWWNMGLEGIADGKFVASLLSDVRGFLH